MKETLTIKLSTDKKTVELSGIFSTATIKFPDTVEELLSHCEQALQKYHAHHNTLILTIDFTGISKIASIGFSILEADVQDFALGNKAKLKFTNFPKAIKPSLETRALYHRLSEQDGIHFRE